MNKERLLKLAAFLREVPEEKFEMSVWANADLTDCQELKKCGTVACALGWATVCFRGEGLRQSAEGGIEFAATLTGELIEAGPIRSSMVFFDISENQAYSLFLPSRYRLSILEQRDKITPDEVANRIETMVYNNN